MRHIIMLLTLACLSALAPAQTSPQDQHASPPSAHSYDWAITHTETRFVDDTDEVKSRRKVITLINMSIEPEPDRSLRVTINSLDVAMPDAPSGPLHYSSAQPEPSGESAPPNPLARAFAPLVGLSFTLTHDPDRQIIIASDELTELPHLGTLGQAISPPYLTIPFAPFMMAAHQPDAQADEDHAPLSFRLIPDVGGMNAPPIDLDYETRQTHAIVTTALKLKALEPANLQGVSIDAKINVSAQSDAVTNRDTSQVMVHTYTITQGMRSTAGARRKHHTEFTTAVTVTPVAQDNPKPDSDSER